MGWIPTKRTRAHGFNSFVTQPNMYARGILFGTMKYELGDHAYVRCPETGFSADIEFKTKGYFSGTYDAIGGFIKDSNGKNLYEFSGLWNDKMYIKDLTVSFTHLHYRFETQECLLMVCRLARKNCSSMPRTRSTRHRRLDHWRNKKKESHSGYGTRSQRRSSGETRT